MESIVLNIFIIAILAYVLLLIKKLIKDVDTMAKFTIKVYKGITPGAATEEGTAPAPGPDSDEDSAGSGGEDADKAPAPGLDKTAKTTKKGITPKKSGPVQKAKKPARKKSNTTKTEHKANQHADKVSQAETVEKVTKGRGK